MLKVYLYLFFLIGFLYGCNLIENKEQSAVQVSTIDALMQGVYDGDVTFSYLLEKGNFGIATVNSLDGEIIIFDSEIYQVKADGKVIQIADTFRTPFGTITEFDQEYNYKIENLGFEEFKILADSLYIEDTQVYAIHIEGEFEYIRTRSVPAQKKPYPDLVEVTANQPEFEKKYLKGQLVGFYCPEYFNGLNVTGYHLHFLSEEKDFGGHLLDFKLISGQLVLDKINHYEILIPDEGDFLKSDFSVDRSEEVKEVES